jgi:hypothetical protein
MRRNLFVLAVLVAASSFAFSQSSKPSAAENGGSEPAGHHKHSSITGCLTSAEHDTYRLVDQKGVTNMVYSSTVHLDSYVGHSEHGHRDGKTYAALRCDGSPSSDGPVQVRLRVGMLPHSRGVEVVYGNIPPGRQRCGNARDPSTPYVLRALARTTYSAQDDRCMVQRRVKSLGSWRCRSYPIALAI